MKVITIVNSLFEENTYLLCSDNICIIIDPGSDKEIIEKNFKKNNLIVTAIFITHYHIDHIASLNYFKEKYNIQVFDNKNAGKQNIGNIYFEIIKTYGHTDDCVTFYIEKEKIMFTGDFLFKGSIGRCDFENSSYDDMKKSLKLIKTFDKNVTIYPGHGELSTLGNEFNNNYYLK